MFDNIKRGNHYEVTRRVTNYNQVFPEEGFPFGFITINLDSESNYLESSVNHILEVIGTIGGSVELVHYVLLLMYSRLRKNLYFHTLINRMHDYHSSHNHFDEKVNVYKSRNLRKLFKQTKTQQKSMRHQQQDESKHEMQPADISQNQN